MNISAINIASNNISCKGFFGKSVIKKSQINNYKIIDTVREYFPFSDESIADLNKITKDNDKFNTAKHSDGFLYKF